MSYIYFLHFTQRFKKLEEQPSSLLRAWHIVQMLPERTPVHIIEGRLVDSANPFNPHLFVHPL